MVVREGEDAERQALFGESDTGRRKRLEHEAECSAALERTDLKRGTEVRERLIWDPLVLLHRSRARQYNPEPSMRLGHQRPKARHLDEILGRVGGKEVV